VLVNLMAIPAYAHLLDPATFGLIAVILSLQAFFLFFDFGLGTVLARSMAIAHAARDDALLNMVYDDLRRAEFLVAVAGLGLGLGGVVLALVADVAGQGTIVMLAAPLLSILVVQNIYQLCLNASGRYRRSGLVSTLAPLVRAVASIAALLLFSRTAQTFLVAQLFVGAIALLATRLTLAWAAPRTSRKLLQREDLGRLWRECRPLIIYTLSGAAALNLDKPIVSAVLSLEAAGTFFLATTYALVPIGLLAGPLFQYFSPMVAGAEANDGLGQGEIARQFLLYFVLVVTAPAYFLLVDAEFWIGLWLGGGADVSAVTQTARPILVGAAIGALGYYPLSTLIAKQDNGFLALASLACSAAILLAAMVIVRTHGLEGMAYAYAAYHVLTCLLLWVRAGSSRTGQGLLRIWVRYHFGPSLAVLGGVHLLRISADRWPISWAPPPIVAAAMAAFTALVVVGLLWSSGRISASKALP
jgi:O-antigen/teichoic acid export membrane protein